MNMKKMKIVSALMAMAMSVTSMGLVASAASDVNVKIGKETVEKGATFSVDVDLSSLPSTGLSSIDFAISYDKSVIKPTKVTLGTAGNTGAAAQEGDLGSTLFDSYITDDQIIIIWATGLTDSQYWVKDGTFLTIEGTAVGEAGTSTDLKGEAVDRAAYPGGSANGDIVFSAVGESSVQDYTAAFTNGSVTIGGGGSSDNAVWGDVDESGTVDVADAVLLARFNAEDSEAVVSDQGKINADVTHDGKRAGDDVVKILRYIALIITKDDLAKA
jgi:hypothetical protein